MSDLKDKTVKGVFWQFAERIGAESVTLLVSIVLARLLLPEDYGIIALIQVFISFSTVFITSGFSAALIQKKDANESDFYSALYASIVLGIVLYEILFFAAPAIAEFCNKKEVIGVLRVLSLEIPILSVKSIEQAYLTKKFQFKSFFCATIMGTLFSAIVGITMAYLGFGVWALCTQSLTNYIIDTIALAVLIRKPIKWIFSIDSIKGLFDFSLKMLMAGLINSLYMNLKNLIIGKVYTVTDLSYFNKGEQFPRLFASNISTTIETVFFPALSSEQDNIVTVKRLTKRFVKVSTYLMFPILLGFASIADTLVPFLLTEKWNGCIIYLQIFCFMYLFNPLQIATIQPIKALGYATLYLKTEIIRKVIGFIIIILSMNYGVVVIAIASLGISVFNWLVNSFTAAKAYGYSVLEQIRDFSGNLVISIVMGLLVLLANRLPLHPFLVLMIQICGGIVSYGVLSIMTHNETFYYLKHYIQEKMIKRQ